MGKNKPDLELKTKSTQDQERPSRELKAEQNKTEPKPPKKRRFKKLKSFFFVLTFILILLAAFTSQILVSGQSSTSWLSRLPLFNRVRQLAESADKQVKGEDRDRINVLLLGMGGKNHDGGELTDTIILASLEPSTKKVALISFPRDLTVPMENLGWRKINNVNAFAEAKNQGSGGLAISQALADILNMPIDYYVRVDFDGFINIIDKMDGIKVKVENTLDDYRYPIRGREDAEPYDSRFEHLHVDIGQQTMDGEFALKFARSRHALGAEGSDFARARRQQLIIQAAKDKLLTAGVLMNPVTMTGIINELQDHIQTNFKAWEMLKLWGMFKNVNSDQITNKVLDNSPSGLLVSGISDDGAYILTPRSGDFSEIEYLIHNIFADAPIDTKTNVVSERATIEIRNGTWINGLASKISLDLEQLGFIVVRIGNSSHQNFQKSVIYDLSYGEKPRSLETLKNKTGANVSAGLPDWLVDDVSQEIKAEDNPVQPDFIIVIGQDADKTESGTANPSDL